MLNMIKKLGDFLVIVEYCRFDNLQNFLLAHRPAFIRQVDVLGSLITPNKGNQQWWFIEF